MASKKRSRWKILAVSCGATGTENQTSGAPQNVSPKGTFHSTADFIRCFPGLQEMQGADAQVQFVDRPSLQILQNAVQAFHPNLVFFGQRRPAISQANGRSLHDGGVIGPLILGEIEPPTVENLAQIFTSHAPDLVLANAVLTIPQAEAIRSKGTPHVIYWPAPAPHQAASHFFTALFSVLRNPSLNPHDAYRIADASHRIHYASLNPVNHKPPNSQTPDSKLPNPVVSGEPPPRDISCSPDIQQRLETSPVITPLSKPRQDLRLLLFGRPRSARPQAAAAASLWEGLRVLLAAEVRELRLVSHAAAAAPTEQIAAMFERTGNAFVRCELCAGEGVRVCVTVVGCPEAFADREILELRLKSALLERLNLQTPPKPASLLPARRTTTIASGAPTCEVTITLPDWAKDLLCQLAADVTYRPLAALGLAGLGGLAVAAFSAADGERLRALEESRSGEVLVGGCANGGSGEAGVRYGGVDNGVSGTPRNANGGISSNPDSPKKPVVGLNADRAAPDDTRADGSVGEKRSEGNGGLEGRESDPPGTEIAGIVDGVPDRVADRKRREEELTANLRVWKRAAIESARSDGMLARPVSQRFRQPIPLAPVTPEQVVPPVGGPGALGGVMSPGAPERSSLVVMNGVASPQHPS